MKKLTVAALIIGAFVFYSFLHAQASGAVLNPKTLADAASPAVTPTTTSAPPATGTASTAAASDPPTATTATNTPTPQPTPTTPAGSAFKDGSFTGNVANAQWGYVQVKAVISGGKITTVQWVQYPNDRSRSIYINSIADPELTSEAVQTQSAQVDLITGATDSSYAFIQSLTTALAQAKA